MGVSIGRECAVTREYTSVPLHVKRSNRHASRNTGTIGRTDVNLRAWMVELLCALKALPTSGIESVERIAFWQWAFLTA